MPAGNVRRARAFAPCHATGIVLPATDARDPRARGSLGAGLVLSLGVTATVSRQPARRFSLRVVSRAAGPLPISADVARRLLGGHPGRFTVTVDHDLPIGQGFGTSAAGALATALASAALVGAPRGDAIEVAHLADLFGGGGLGGVAAILGGGLELRTAPGIPPFGTVVRVPHPGSVLVGTVGPPLPSPRLLSDPAVLERLRRAANSLGRFGTRPDPATFWEVAEAFTARAGLSPAPLTAVLRGLRSRGARAAQAMFGTGFVATAPTARAAATIAGWLTERGVWFRITTVASLGARRLPDRRHLGASTGPSGPGRGALGRRRPGR